MKFNKQNKIKYMCIKFCWGYRFTITFSLKRTAVFMTGLANFDSLFLNKHEHFLHKQLYFSSEDYVHLSSLSFIAKCLRQSQSCSKHSDSLCFIIFLPLLPWSPWVIHGSTLLSNGGMGSSHSVVLSILTKGRFLLLILLYKRVFFDAERELLSEGREISIKNVVTNYTALG